MKIVSLSWVILLASLSSFGTTPQTGAIKGTVVDEAGNPIAAAQVSTGYDLDSKDVQVWAGQVPTFPTDANGHFAVTNPNLVVGHHYKVYAKKEEAGYPDMMNSLFNPRDEAVVALAKSKDRALDVTVQLGPKAMVLTWDVKDSVTGRSLNNIVTFYVKRADEGDAGGSNQDRKLLLPADVPVTVEFSAKGYKTLYYPGTPDKAASTALPTVPGQEVALRVSLQPDSKYLFLAQ
jgi:hypothetical protein